MEFDRKGGWSVVSMDGEAMLMEAIIEAFMDGASMDGVLMEWM